ncbi:hypothetical protein [Bradyrhizobium liaoningense]
MNNAVISAIAALAGSAIGAIASFATTWLSLQAQERTQLFASAMSRREHLYGDFIDEASRLVTEGITHDTIDPAKFVRLYAILGKLRLFASETVVASADEVVRHILDLYATPSEHLRDFGKKYDPDADILRDFSLACRRDLNV